jgi:hypothetical protein
VAAARAGRAARVTLTGGATRGQRLLKLNDLNYVFMGAMSNFKCLKVFLIFILTFYKIILEYILQNNFRRCSSN